MSLYDSFFSVINKDHVYHLIKDIVFENNGVNIFLDDEYKQIYNKNLQRIFEDNNVNTLEELNKIVINEIILEFYDKLKNNDEKDFESNVNSAYDNLFSERMKQNSDFKNIKENEEKAENDRKIFEEEKQKKKKKEKKKKKQIKK